MNKHPTKFLFTTEGHIFPISMDYRHKTWEEEEFMFDSSGEKAVKDSKPEVLETLIVSNATEDVSKLCVCVCVFVCLGGKGGL